MRRWLLMALAHVLVAILLACLATGGGPARAAMLEPGPEVTVGRAVDGATLLLADGTTLRLVGLAAPPARSASDAEARQALAALVAGGTVRLAFDGAERDRYGRMVAHAYAPDGRWLQGELLARGLARVQTAPDHRGLAAAMLAVESAAREAGRGLWADPDFVVVPAEGGNWPWSGFVLVEGRIQAATTVAGRAYLNFGADWREDFTVTIAPADLKTYLSEGGAVETLAGRRVRVRGWLGWYNGPEIVLNHREQIEILDP